MSPRGKKALVESAPVSRADALVRALKKNDESSSAILASDLMKNWRYIDFVNPIARLPCIALEWMFGARGLLAGRMMKLQASFGKGKSSLMWLIYACGQLMADAFCFHIESEGAPPPPDYIASFGCDPHNLVTAQPQALESCFETIDTTVAQIRGGFGGEMNARGEWKESKFKDSALDPAMNSPVVLGVDALSAFGLTDQVLEDVAAMGENSAIAKHSRMMGDYMRRRAERFAAAQVLNMWATHEKANIRTGPPGFQQKGGSEKVTLAEAPIGFHSTWIVTLSSSRYVPKSGPNAGVDIGDVITIRTVKNKISPKHRELDVYLVRDHGFDLIKTDVDFLSGPVSPIAVKRTPHGIECDALNNEKKFKSEEELMRAFYAHTDLLMTCREKLRIRGCGFDFETKYMPSCEEVEDNQASAESDIDGVAKAEVPAAGVAG